MTINTFEEKFEHALGDMYDAEHRFYDAQQEMAAKTDSADLRTLLEQHNQQTKGHIANLERVFRLLDKEPRRVKCEAAIGLVVEGQRTMQDAGTPEIMNWVIATAQAKIEHYEIASYRGLIIGAEIMKNEEIAVLLQTNLRQEEGTADAVQGEPRELEEEMAEKAAEAEKS